MGSSYAAQQLDTWSPLQHHLPCHCQQHIDAHATSPPPCTHRCRCPPPGSKRAPRRRESCPPTTAGQAAVSCRRVRHVKKAGRHERPGTGRWAGTRGQAVAARQAHSCVGRRSPTWKSGVMVRSTLRTVRVMGCTCALSSSRGNWCTRLRAGPRARRGGAGGRWQHTHTHTH